MGCSPVLFWGHEMERQRGEEGTFVSAGEGKRAVGAPRPQARYCRSYTRRRIAEALPEIVETFVDEAKKGSIPHTKMLTNLAGLDKREAPTAKKRKKSAVRLLLESFDRGCEAKKDEADGAEERPTVA